MLFDSLIHTTTNIRHHFYCPVRQGPHDRKRRQQDAICPPESKGERRESVGGIDAGYRERKGSEVGKRDTEMREG